MLSKNPWETSYKPKNTKERNSKEEHLRNPQQISPLAIIKKATGTLVDEEDDAEAEEMSSNWAENTKRRNRNHVGTTKSGAGIEAGATPKNSHLAASSRAPEP